MPKDAPAQGEGLIELTIGNLVDLVAGKKVAVEDTKLKVVLVHEDPLSESDLKDASKLVKGAKELRADLETQAEAEDEERELSGADDDEDLDEDELDEDEDEDLDDEEELDEDDE